MPMSIYPLIAIVSKAITQITRRLLSTKELVVQMATAFIAPVPLFRGGGNYSLYFAKTVMALAFSNSPDFHFSVQD